jgi:signal transduction histidine kinase
VAQHLAAADMTGAALYKRLEAASSPQVEEAARLNQLIRGAQEKVRALIRGVRPVDVVPAGLVDALRDLTASVQERHNVACALEISDGAALTDAKTATQLYYIAAEAVHNAVKHATPRRIVVRLTADGAALVLEVRDDGTGIGTQPRDGGTGLQIMTYRAGLIGGLLDVAAAQGDGLDLVREIAARGASVKMLVLSMHDESTHARSALQAGAAGYLVKTEASDRLVDLIRRTLAGEK